MMSLEKLIALAKEKNGACISEKYLGARQKHKWQCSQGHVWEAVHSNIKKGSWCPYCANRVRLGIDAMKTIAVERGGKCLSEKYYNRATKLLWECSCGYQFDKTPGHIMRGQWCPKCSKRPHITIDDIKELSISKGGQCLSNVYVNKETKLLFKCEYGHKWEARPNHIRRGSWCPVCSGRDKWSIQTIKMLAKERGGQCLSEEYINNSTKLIWKCGHNHTWEALPATIISGGWCPECSTSLGERITRAFFEQLFQKPFPKNYPLWLTNDRGNRMELDGYCSDLKLAFEHQGEQHYSISNLFITDTNQLKQRQKDDLTKVILCRDNNVKLISVPSIPQKLNIKDIKSFIKEECLRLNVPLPYDFELRKVDLSRAYMNTHSVTMMEAILDIVKKKEGQCLSNNYVNDRTKMRFKCREGHLWETTPNRIKQGKWCPECSGNIKLTLDEFQRLASSRGGKCLSETYANSKTKLLWECSKGHQWEAVPSSVKTGRWCPYCGGTKRKTLEDMHRLAKLKDGKCLSKTYANNKTKLLWECKYGHQWRTSPYLITQGNWCPECAGTKKKTIEDMYKLAKKRGGACLSKIYTNKETKLLWECEHGHRWKAVPNSIKNGTWCPFCSGRRLLTIEEMKQIALSRGGICLSSSYVNSKTKLTWECSKGHHWRAIPSLVKRGTWCPHCSGRAKHSINDMDNLAKSKGGECLSNEYVNACTKLRWKCSDGHEWEAQPRVIRAGSWCPTCRRRK